MSRLKNVKGRLKIREIAKRERKRKQIIGKNGRGIWKNKTRKGMNKEGS